LFLPVGVVPFSFSFRYFLFCEHIFSFYAFLRLRQESLFTRAGKDDTPVNYQLFISGKVSLLPLKFPVREELEARRRERKNLNVVNNYWKWEGIL